MKWLIDEQLPPQLTDWLIEQGEEAIHSKELPYSTDKELSQWAVQQGYIVVSKDIDLLEWHVRLDPSPSLLYLSLQNIKTSDLINLFRRHWCQLCRTLRKHTCVEMRKEEIHIHW
ncbi:MAG: DUF5615 family PIN-like protein [Bacteroidota bacterium]